MKKKLIQFKNIVKEFDGKLVLKGVNLDIYEKWMARGRAMSARDRYYYAREWMALGDYAAGEREFARFLAMPEVRMTMSDPAESR